METKKLSNEQSKLTPVEGDKNKRSTGNIQQKTNESKKLKEENFLQGFVSKQAKNKRLLKTQLQSVERLASLPKMKVRKKLSFSVAPRFKVERPQTQLSARQPSVVQFGDGACKITYSGRIGGKSSGSFAGEKTNGSSPTKLAIDSYFANKNSNRGENYLHNYLLLKKNASLCDLTSPAIGKHAGNKNSSSKTMYPMLKLSLNTYKIQQKQSSASRKNSFNQTYNNFVERNDQGMEKVSYDNLARLKTPKLPKTKPCTNPSSIIYKHQKKYDTRNEKKTNIVTENQAVLLSKRLRTPPTMKVLSRKYRDRYRLQLAKTSLDFY